MSLIAVGGSALLSTAITGGTIAAGAGLLGVGASLYEGNKAQQALSSAQQQQQALVSSLKYQPIDINQLATDAANQAATNAAASLALERSLQPAVAGTRANLASTVQSQLALGGKLSPDIANQVAEAARTQGGLSGAPAGPITAASIGTTANALQQQRIGNATSLLAANPLPVAGLDPGSLASEEVAQNTAQNQFNLAKAGVSSNLINSGANVAGAQAGLQSSQAASLLSLVKQFPSLLGGGAPTSTPTSGVSSLMPTGSLSLSQLTQGNLGVPNYSIGSPTTTGNL